MGITANIIDQFVQAINSPASGGPCAIQALENPELLTKLTGAIAAEMRSSGMKIPEGIDTLKGFFAAVGKDKDFADAVGKIIKAHADKVPGQIFGDWVGPDAIPVPTLRENNPFACVK